VLNNAVKFTTQGEIRLQVERRNDVFCFTVTDSGRGISEEQQQHIFEKFHQSDDFLTSDQIGTGLGLALATELVTLMGGTMGVKSKLGEGSSFFFTLPAL
jgi:signal transduction histidine kinase